MNLLIFSFRREGQSWTVESGLIGFGLWSCAMMAILIGAAIFGFFTAALSVAMLVLWGVGGLWTLWKISFRSEGAWFYGAIGVAALFVIGTGFFFHDLALGRDDMGYLIGSQKLVDSGSLAWEDYFSRPYHSVRWLRGDVFTSQFLPLYSTMLALPLRFLGPAGLGLVNMLFWFLGLGCLFFLARRLSSSSPAGFWSVAFVATTFTSIWFSRRLNSENVWFFLFWLGCLLMVRGLQERRSRDLALAFFPVVLAILSRGEAFLIVGGWTVFALVGFWLGRKSLNRIAVPALKWWVLTLLPLGLFIVYVNRYHSEYLLDQIRAMLEIFDLVRGFRGVVVGVLILAICILAWKKRKAWGSTIFSPSLGRWVVAALSTGGFLIEGLIIVMEWQERLPWKLYRIHLVLETGLWYMVFPAAALMIVALVRGRWNRWHTVMALMVLPMGVLVLQPNIALDHPWFMRRFFAIGVPWVFLTGASVLPLLFRRHHIWIGSAIVIANLLIASPILFFREHDGIRAQLHDLSKAFSSEDLLLLKPGWGWQKWVLPMRMLYGTTALPNIDLFRPERFKNDLQRLELSYPDWKKDDKDLLVIYNAWNDLQEKELTALVKQYTSIYVLTDSQVSPHPNFQIEDLTFLKPITISAAELEHDTSLTRYVREEGNRLSTAEIRRRRPLIPRREIAAEEWDLFLYRVSAPSSTVLDIRYGTEDDRPEDDDSTFRILTQSELADFRLFLYRLLNQD